MNYQISSEKKAKKRINNYLLDNIMKYMIKIYKRG